MRRLNIFILTGASAFVLARCMPATANAVTAANIGNAITCTTNALGSMGYDVLAADEQNRLVQGQRFKHATNPFNGAMDADRITVSLDRDENGTTGLHIVGETVGTINGVRGPRERTSGNLFPAVDERSNSIVRKRTSHEVSVDTGELARMCSESTREAVR